MPHLQSLRDSLNIFLVNLWNNLMPQPVEESQLTLLLIKDGNETRTELRFRWPIPHEEILRLIWISRRRRQFVTENTCDNGRRRDGSRCSTPVQVLRSDKKHEGGVLAKWLREHAFKFMISSIFRWRFWFIFARKWKIVVCWYKQCTCSALVCCDCLNQEFLLLKFLSLEPKCLWVIVSCL